MKNAQPQQYAKNMVLLLAMTLISASLTSCDNSPADPKTAPIMDLMSGGQTAVVAAAQAGTPCFDSVESMKNALDAEAESDDIGYRQVVNEHAIGLFAGSKVRFIDNSAAVPGGAVRFRIESGAEYGQACWVFGDERGLVKNVHGE